MKIRNIIRFIELIVIISVIVIVVNFFYKRGDSQTYIFVNTWGNKGNGDGQFLYPRFITVDTEGYIYVSDLSENCIQKFNSQGDFITKWGNKGESDGKFNNTKGISVDKQRNLYVVD